MPEIRIVAGPVELARAAAEQFVRAAGEAVAARGAFRVCLAGGSTPRALYALLADAARPFRAAIAWDRLHAYFGDERAVPPDHPDSNYRMAYEALLSIVPLRPGGVVRFWSEGEDPEAVAAYYEQLLRETFGVPEGEVPRFDLVLLGLGKDGHTASLFPGSDALGDTERLAAAPLVAGLGARRYTVTPKLLNAAARVLFLVSGGEKADALREVLRGEYRPERYPAQIVRPERGEVVWLVDRAAARRLD